MDYPYRLKSANQPFSIRPQDSIDLIKLALPHRRLEEAGRVPHQGRPANLHDAGSHRLPDNILRLSWQGFRGGM